MSGMIDSDDLSGARTVMRANWSVTPTIPRLGDCYKPLHLRPADLPSLLTLRGSMHAAASVLPDRLVQWFNLVGHESVMKWDLERIAQTIPLENSAKGSLKSNLCSRQQERTIAAKRPSPVSGK
ncbi:hypothetical protein BDY19DRAFT_997751 [Irpex rosettiformis]|uniref:Uncharacterized protein n=1 Tax=Irpex rosettiformis TaxID=378272 RepID=A0ACB8TQS9_9APHY|nr:hypothetical protein BDY19DRAFT_997751 [Irpex rosettiformis]